MTPFYPETSQMFCINGWATQESISQEDQA